MIKIDIVMVVVATTLVAAPTVVLIIGYCGFGAKVAMVVAEKVATVGMLVGATMVVVKMVVV